MMRTAETLVTGLNVSRETLAALEKFEALVRRWNPAINLVSKATLPDLWTRHILDSAQIFSFCPEGAEAWADLGSGGGFPGLVVAILARELKPDLHVALVESDRRKATFLRQVSQELALQASVYSERIESLPPLRANVLSARALAPLSDLLPLADKHLAEGGLAIFPKGARYVEELAKAKTQWVFDLDVRQSVSDAAAAILVIRNIHREKH